VRRAVLTGAWILTDGVHSGLSKYVGDAVRTHTLTHGNMKPITAVGITPWGCVSNHSLLVNQQVSCTASFYRDAFLGLKLNCRGFGVQPFSILRYEQVCRGYRNHNAYPSGQGCSVAVLLQRLLCFIFHPVLFF